MVTWTTKTEILNILRDVIFVAGLRHSQVGPGGGQRALLRGRNYIFPLAVRFAGALTVRIWLHLLEYKRNLQPQNTLISLRPITKTDCIYLPSTGSGGGPAPPQYRHLALGYELRCHPEICLLYHPAEIKSNYSSSATCIEEDTSLHQPQLNSLVTGYKRSDNSLG